MEIADHKNAPLVYLVVMTRKCQWFSWTCWSLALLALRLSTIFFSFSKISESQTDPLCEEEENSISVRLAWIIFSNLFYYSAYFFLLFMSHITLFGTIHRSHYTISVNFYLYLQYFQQKKFSFSKINRF